MNEQINILAEQAGLHCDGTPDCWDQEAIARFAQLIVRECAYIMDKDADHPFVSRGSILKHHFGVEE